MVFAPYLLCSGLHQKLNSFTKLVIGNGFTLYVPNSFSPNGDGTNDVFTPKGMGIKDYELSIFSRWRQLLFSSNEASNCWDGCYKGSDCKADIC